MTVYLISSFPLLRKGRWLHLLFCLVWWPWHLRAGTVILVLPWHRVSSSSEALDTLNKSNLLFMILFVKQLVKLRIMRAAVRRLSVFAFTFIIFLPTACPSTSRIHLLGFGYLWPCSSLQQVRWVWRDPVQWPDSFWGRVAVLLLTCPLLLFLFSLIPNHLSHLKPSRFHDYGVVDQWLQ